VGDSVSGLAVFGSTGSIGRQTLDVVRGLRRHFRVVALSGGRNVTLLQEQAREFSPRFVCYDGNESPAKNVIGVKGVDCLPMEAMATHPDVDIVVIATVGKAGLFSTLAALEAGKTVALANKEVLVMAGKLVVEAARRGHGEIRPIDSEHSAIWQCLRGEKNASIRRLILTASGGALRDKNIEELRRVTPEQALSHPTWQMGRKITVDSATLLNKGLEAIEARWLFDVPLDRIEIVLHRESIVHSLVEFTDGSLKAQIGTPDMRVPIQVALCYPERPPLPSVPYLDLKRIGSLHFAELKLDHYPCLALALEAGHRGGTYPAVMSAADEVAVGAFLSGQIGFMRMPEIIDDTLNAHEGIGDPTLDDILAADIWAREQAENLIGATT
jgi:1-deoxy-D-xylulose-5-phosphate reductoisomerase